MKNNEIKNLTDEQLVAQFQTTGDNVFFGEIYTRHHKKVFATCMKIVKDRDTAYDLVQDIMIKVMAKLPDLQHGFLLGFWIHRIAKNSSIDYWKEQKGNHYIAAEECLFLAEDYSKTDQENKEARFNMIADMEKLLDQLKEEDAVLLKLKYFENYSVQDLENQYQLSKSAVKMRLARARKKLKVLLDTQSVQVNS